MISNLQGVLSAAAKGMKKSAIRELLKLTRNSEIISFAGGLPAPETFPIEQLTEVTSEVLREDGEAALQYGSTEGDSLLREEIVQMYREKGFDISLNNVMITTASQQGLDLIAKIFVDRGDKVICGLPSYLGGLQAFKNYGADLVGIEFDDAGMRADKLDEKLTELKRLNDLPKFIYIIPDFQNPAGVTMTNARRKEIITIAQKFDLLILEDSPYKELRFEGEEQKSLYVLDGEGHVINFGTFSKIFVPGFRIGWVIAHEDIVNQFVKAKQATDLCTSPFVQKVAAKYVQKGYFKENLVKTIELYREKRDIMMAAFDEFMPEGVSWTKPEGGLFLFITLPEYMDSEILFHKALEKKVAFVVGNVFHCNNEGRNTMRINFSYTPKDLTKIGVQRLAEVIKAEMR